MMELNHKTNLTFPEESHQIIGAAMAVHRYFGCGFSEKVYQDALEVEFRNQGIPYQREVQLKAVYNGVELSSSYIPDFICYDKIIVELKAVKELEDIHRSQAINYAKVSDYPLALLINFGEYSLKFERFPNRR
ncbi:GxxExxY protein [Xylanibacter ruminicola]|uniref:GxxExxY protein n=1 Tax=Xylanibacter ruminicola TaxID=839 RepID=A0A1M6TH97_XYLRU|nr:GxxExxY protein [Xylanibacter ruminicola]SHK56347.1 GxxExxY protein [Xylanibacter ruminicola]